MRSAGDSAGWRSNAIGTVSAGAGPPLRSGTEPVQSVGTARVPHWKPSPQSLQASAASNAGSGGQVVVVVVVDGLGLAPVCRSGTEPAGSASAREQHDDEEREDESLHGQAGSPHGLGRPSLPGFRMPWGSSAALVAASTANASPSAGCANRARFSPTP